MHLRFLELGWSLDKRYAVYRRSVPRSMKLCPRNWTLTLEKRGKLFPYNQQSRQSGDCPYLEPGYFSLVLSVVSARPRASSDGFRTLPRDPWLPLPERFIFGRHRMGFSEIGTMNCGRSACGLGSSRRRVIHPRHNVSLNSGTTVRSFNLLRDPPCRLLLMKPFLDIGNLGSRGGIRSLLKRAEGSARNPHRRVLRGCIFGF